MAGGSISTLILKILLILSKNLFPESLRRNAAILHFLRKYLIFSLFSVTGTRMRRNLSPAAFLIFLSAAARAGVIAVDTWRWCRLDMTGAAGPKWTERAGGAFWEIDSCFVRAADDFLSDSGVGNAMFLQEGGQFGMNRWIFADVAVLRIPFLDGGWLFLPGGENGSDEFCGELVGGSVESDHSKRILLTGNTHPRQSRRGDLRRLEAISKPESEMGFRDRFTMMPAAVPGVAFGIASQMPDWGVLSLAGETKFN